MKSARPYFRCPVDGAEALTSLREAPLPLDLTSTATRHLLHRDVYLDTDDGALASRGLVCRIRYQSNDRRSLALISDGRFTEPFEGISQPIHTVDPGEAVQSTGPVGRRLRGVVDPKMLEPQLALETERWLRPAFPGAIRIPRLRFGYDLCTVRQDGLAGTVEELFVERILPGGPSLDKVATAIEREFGLRPVTVSRFERASWVAANLAAEAAARRLSSHRAVVLLVLEAARAAFLQEPNGISLPTAWGSGEDACRHILEKNFGSTVGELSFLGQNPGTADRPAIEVWVARRIRGSEEAPRDNLVWLNLVDALANVGTPARYPPETLGALALAASLQLNEMPTENGDRRTAEPTPFETLTVLPGTTAAPPVERTPTILEPADRFLNIEMSQLSFVEGVLAFVRSEMIPLAERLRYCAIVTGLLDEFFATRVAALKTAVIEGSTTRSADGLLPTHQLDAIAARAPRIVQQHQEAASRLLAQLPAHGLRILKWDDLDKTQRAQLDNHFDNELLPLITPQALLRGPGHPFPTIPHLTLSFATVIRYEEGGPPHFAYLPIPQHLGRWVAVPGTNHVVAVEEVIRAHLQRFFPERSVDEAWLIRLTRGTDLDLDDEDAGDLLQVIEEEMSRRYLNLPVRLEAERAMPARIRDLLMRELRFERRGVVTRLGASDAYSIDGMLDYSALGQLARKLPASDHYPKTVSRNPFPSERSLFDLIDQQDRLIQHPGDDFDTTVARFAEEAATDPHVASIKISLYRVGDTSPIIDALVRAALFGKEIFAFVELRARLEETRNTRWVRRLEAAGVHVVYGIAGLKTHMKAMLVVRREGGETRRYVHIASGNYNPVTAKAYTDFGFFTSDDDITSDVIDLFNELTGSTVGPVGHFRKLLVGPRELLPKLLERIDREIDQVRKGHGGLIRAQVNGLDEPDIISALYRASEAGVRIELIVRGICALRPQVKGLSANITVKRILGRYLEHQRIIHFHDGGLDEYFIGSADLRVRNLRRRVEILVPIARHDLKRRLGAIFDRLWAEPTAAVLYSDGHYSYPTPVPFAKHVHRYLFEEP